MTDYQMNRRQALLVGGLGALSLGMPGAVIGSDKLLHLCAALRRTEPRRYLGYEA
jgi:hypothetical protein